MWIAKNVKKMGHLLERSHFLLFFDTNDFYDNKNRVKKIRQLIMNQRN